MAGFQNGVLSLDSNLYTTSSGDNNDVPVNSSLLYVTVSNNNDAITGLALGDNSGALVFVVNTGPTNNLVIKNNSGSSSATNVILTSTGADVTVAAYSTAVLGYDTTNQQWHLIKFV